MLALFVLIGIAATIFWIWMLVECATKEPDYGDTKVVWVIIIALTGWLGALLYFFIRRPRRMAEEGQ